MKTRYPFLDIDIDIPKDKADAVQAISSWLSFQPHLPPLNDETIALFLHSCYYSLERTKDTIENFHSLRAKCPEFFAGWDLENMTDMWKISDMIALPKPTPKGYRILIYRLKDYDASKLQFNHVVRCFCAFNMVKISEDGLVPGYVVILDMKGVTFSHFMRVTPYLQSVRNILQYLQECHPVRLKEVHIINTVSFMDRILSVVKPFIQSNLMNILHLHGSADSLADYFPLDLLSEEYNGKQISGSKLHNQFVELIDNRYQPYLKECEKYVSTNRTGNSKSKKEVTNNATSVTLEGSFRRLDID